MINKLNVIITVNEEHNDEKFCLICYTNKNGANYDNNLIINKQEFDNLNRSQKFRHNHLINNRFWVVDACWSQNHEDVNYKIIQQASCFYNPLHE